MAAEIRIPELGESITEATLVRWLKADGAHVEADEVVLELETEKAAMEVQAETAGRLSIVVPAGSRVHPGDVVGRITEAATAERPTPATAGRTGAPSEPSRAAAGPRAEPRAPREASRSAEPARTAEPSRSAESARTAEPSRFAESARTAEPPSRREPREPGDASRAASSEPARQRPGEPRGDGERVAAPEPSRTAATPHDGDGRGGAARAEDDAEREPMSQLRRTIAARLVEAQRTAAILTTFNEVDLGELLALRARYRERFKARHGVDLGLMSLFARAVIHGLREVPILNARIDGTDIVKPRHVHLGIAVSTPRGLVVPVVRGAEALALAALEKAIGDVARRAREAKLAPGDLVGGTFTITNGGVFGSLLSTPILNPPQSGILGMHKIEDRPVARDGHVVIRPMMYVALSYDHRLVDGEQAVTFLVRVKEALEDPARMVLEV
jgi:2-oxoglutarate dehydrogenase E2 component (dihydrolipoamide succinyltransferase)